MKFKLSLLNIICCLIVVNGLITANNAYSFRKDDRVVLQNTLNGRYVRQNPIIDYNEKPTLIPDGTRGVMLLDDPVVGPNYIWYNIKWDIIDNSGKNLEGWTAQSKLGCSIIGSAEEANKRDAIVFKLFGYDQDELDISVVDELTFHDYNGYGCNPNFEIYVGGHSGLDAQTKDKSTNQYFYSLTDGIVTIAGFTDDNENGIEDKGEADTYRTIGVYNADSNKTILYLHASSVNPILKERIGKRIEQGFWLGKQGDSGSPGKIHVHIEVQEDESKTPSPGSGYLSIKTEDPIDYLYKWVTDEIPDIGGVRSKDVNRDGSVDIIDLLFVFLHINKSAEDYPQYDVNADGEINNDDLIEIVKSFDAAAPSTFNVDSIPKKHALLPNYPNPFNPETWIPYQLSKTANVTLNIYTTNGEIVRSIKLGVMPAGIYKNRSRAIYWDGKNTFGEPVSNGVYFYTLIADNFTDTRKMLILK